MPNYRVFTCMLLSFFAGVVLSSVSNIHFINFWPLFLVSGLLLFLFYVLNIRQKAFLPLLISLMMLSLLLGLVVTSFYQDRYLGCKIEPDKTTYVGKVTKRPETGADQVKAHLMLKDSPCSLVLQAGPRVDIAYGDVLEVQGSLKPHPSFYSKKYLENMGRRGVVGILEVSDFSKIKKLESKLTAKELLLGGIFQLSGVFEKRINELFFEPHSSLAAGLVLGARRNMPDSLKEDLKTTGLTHIIALSGFNVTIIIIGLSTVLLSLIGRLRTLLLSSVLIVVFILMTGAQPSIIRAAIFSAVVIMGKLIGRRPDQANVLLFTAFLMVLFDPLLLYYDLSFQLSFLAFIGIVYLAEPLSIFIKKKTKLITKNITQVFAETLSAQLLVLPLILVSFGNLSLIAPLSNVLVLWAIPYAMGFVALGLFSSFILFKLGEIFSLVAYLFLEYILRAIELLSYVPYAAFELKVMPYLGLFLFLPIIFFIVYANKRVKTFDV